MRQLKVCQYMDDVHEWHWVVFDESGKVHGMSHQGFEKKVDCSTNMQRVASGLTPPLRWDQLR